MSSDKNLMHIFMYARIVYFESVSEIFITKYTNRVLSSITTLSKDRHHTYCVLEVKEIATGRIR